MAKIKGKDLKVEFDGYEIACARSCEVTMENETIEVASATSGQYKEYIKGRTDWSVSVNGLVNTTDDGAYALIHADSVTLIITFGTALTMTGDAICTQVKYTGTIGNLAQYSATFQGSGALS